MPTKKSASTPSASVKPSTPRRRTVKKSTVPGSPEAAAERLAVDIERATPRSAAPSPQAHDESLTEPSVDEIREAAYHRYLQRGGTHGDDFADWLAAERDLRKRPRA